MEANKEIIEFIKEQITEAQIELYLKEVIAKSIKEYEKHRPVYLKNEWSYEDIGNALAKIMIAKVEPPISALGKKEFLRLNSLHKHIVSNNEVAVCDCAHTQACEICAESKDIDWNMITGD